MKTFEMSFYQKMIRYSVQFLANTINSLLVPSKFIGKKVLLLDELYDNGTTLNAVKNRLLENPELKLTPADITTCTLFKKKKSGASVNEPPDYVGCDDMPDVWFVGYGLDDMQEKRGWKHLYAIPKCDGVPKNEDDVIFEETVEGQTKYEAIRAGLLAHIEKDKYA